MDDIALERIRLADIIEAEACADMYRAAPSALITQVRTIGDATVLLAPKVPVSYFNRVIGLGNGAPCRATDLDEVMAVFAGAGVENFWIHLSLGAQPVVLPEWLEQRGFTPAPRRSWAKFLRAPTLPPASVTALCIRPALAADADAVAGIVCAAFGMPPTLAPWFGGLVGRPGWQFLLACTEADQAVATGAVYIKDGKAWLGVGATLPEFRQQGAQTALLRERIRFAIAQGCEVLATETGEPDAGETNPSLANIRRAGFEQVGSRLNFAAPSRR